MASVHTSKSTSSVSGVAATASEKLEGVVDSAIETAQDAASKAATQAKVAGRQANQVAGNMKVAVEESLATQPMTTLAVAAGVGFILGAMWKS